MEILYQNLANIELQHVIMWIIGGILILGGVCWYSRIERKGI